MKILYLILLFLFSISIGYFSFQRKSISKSGFAALILICVVFIFLEEIAYLFLLFSMFSSCTLLSKFQKEKKKDLDLVVSKNGARDGWQAFANLGTSIISILLYLYTKDSRFILAFSCSLSASNADSWASEIGGLSKQKTVSILNFKPIRKGLSGGITLLGTFGGILGALFIAGLVVLTIQNPEFNNLTLFLKTVAVGIFGFMLDSFLGATIQAKYIDLENQDLTEKENNQIASGFSVVNNDLVNFMSTFSAGIVGYFIA